MALCSELVAVPVALLPALMCPSSHMATCSPLLPLNTPKLQFLVSEAAQRVFLVASGSIQLLEGGVQEYVQQLSGGGGKKTAAAGKAAAGAAGSGSRAAGSGASAAAAAAAGLKPGAIKAAKAAAAAAARGGGKKR